MTKKNNTQQAETEWGITTTVRPSNAPHANIPGNLTKEQQYMDEQVVTKLVKVRGHGETTEYAERMVGHMQKVSSSIFAQVALHIEAVNESVQGSEYEELVKNFNRTGMKMTGQNLLAFQDEGAAIIHEEISTRFKEEEKKGWFGR